MGIPFFTFVYLCLLFVLNLLFADAVYRDANKLCDTTGREGTFLVGPRVWWLATALGGLVTVGIYWAIHHSTLRPEPGVHE